MAVLFIIIPFILIIIINLPWRSYVERIAFVIAALYCIVQITGILAFPDSFWNQALPWRKILEFHIPVVDLLSRVMFLCTGLIALISMFVTMQYNSDKKQQFYQLNLILLALIGMNGVIIARSLFTTYVFIEVVSVSSYILISANRKAEALGSAFKYLLLSVIASVLLLAATAIFLLAAKSTDLQDISNLLASEHPYKWLFNIAYLLFAAGLLIKSGVFPFHWWLPGAYTNSPPGVSVLLAGIVTKSCGVYSLFRLFNDVPFFPETFRWIIFTLGLLSIVAGALLALREQDMKRMLAYSSISQIGYIIIAAVSGNLIALIGAGLHIFNHTICKSQLFINAAVIEDSTGTRQLDKLSGIGRMLPVTGSTSLVAMLSLAGVPPLLGFWSKLFIIIGLWQAGYFIPAVIAILASLLTLAYFLVTQKKLFFNLPDAKHNAIKEKGFTVLAITVILAIIAIAGGIAFPFILKIFFA